MWTSPATRWGRPTDFFVACAANPTADDIDIELRRVRAKLDEGGDMLMTQPVYDLATLTGFFERLGPVDVPVLLGILPLMSSRHTEFIHNELAGVVIPDDVRERMRAAGDAGAAAGLEIAYEQIEETRDFDWGVGHLHHALVRPLRGGRGTDRARPGIGAGAGGVANRSAREGRGAWDHRCTGWRRGG